MTTILGIDEAGRGPVIGPMVIAGVLINEKDEQKLRDMQVKDSKLIPPAIREDLFKEIKKVAKDYKIIIIQPKEIDNALETPELNLNKLEAIKSAEIINKLKADKVIIDCASTNENAYKSFIKDRLNYKPEMIVEHKADTNYIVVGAASILAKVTRDNEIEKIRKKYGEIGPGYPSNRITQAFIKENWEKHPEIFRKTWRTYKKFTESKSQKNLTEF